MVPAYITRKEHIVSAKKGEFDIVDLVIVNTGEVKSAMFSSKDFPNVGFADSMLSNVKKALFHPVGVEFGARGQVVAFGKVTA